ncbi:hypothetical protein J6590_057419 [Homalodisca vitripennis]|nr:hypothetical protein J6590_057419 [Homalodisca vitripennis]
MLIKLSFLAKDFSAGIRWARRSRVDNKKLFGQIQQPQVPVKSGWQDVPGQLNHDNIYTCLSNTTSQPVSQSPTSSV